jgi:hypothetical protein
VTRKKVQPLAEGSYSCHATLHIQDGQAVVVLHSMFDLKPGTTIPLARRDGNMLVEPLTGSSVSILNGHTII